MTIGTAKWFNTQKGYGFIQPEDGSKDVLSISPLSSVPGWATWSKASGLATRSSAASRARPRQSILSPRNGSPGCARCFGEAANVRA